MSANGAEFCDTNVLVYAYDLSAGDKRKKGKRLVERLWESGTGALSVQVLQEFYVTVTRKVSPVLSPAEGRAIVSDLATWRVVEPSKNDVIDAIDASIRWGVSFWDAMVLMAAQRADAVTVWSEGLNDGQTYDGIVVHNPFREVGAD